MLQQKTYSTLTYCLVCDYRAGLAAVTDVTVGISKHFPWWGGDTKKPNHAEFSLCAIMLASMEPMIYWEHKVNINVCTAITKKLTD